MGECGCGELHPLAKMRAPDGWYGLEIYPGCDYCDTSWAVGLSHFKDGDEDSAFILEGVPEVDFGKLGLWGHPILDTGVFRREFAKSRSDTDEMSEANFALDDFISRGDLRAVFYETQRQYENENASRAARSEASTAPHPAVPEVLEISSPKGESE